MSSNQENDSWSGLSRTFYIPVHNWFAPMFSCSHTYMHALKGTVAWDFQTLVFSWIDSPFNPIQFFRFLPQFRGDICQFLIHFLHTIPRKKLTFWGMVHGKLLARDLATKLWQKRKLFTDLLTIFSHFLCMEREHFPLPYMESYHFPRCYPGKLSLSMCHNSEVIFDPQNVKKFGLDPCKTRKTKFNSKH